ncbi:hypothetical protein QOZ80_5BG0447660 [Eleusine coracana subsp. coracana]|nr:hypothetical protein QOZ80_5BG0447660 [Eleusine coracana subsp. coracana]
MAALRVNKLDDPYAAVADYDVLPEDVLLYHVLLRLPANEVARLRLVCRSWRSIISDRVFARAHLSRHPQVVALHDGSHKVHVIDLTCAGTVLKRLDLVQNSHGLSTAHDALCVSQGWGQAYVLNIATNNVMIDTGSITGAEDERREDSTTPTTLIGRVPSTGEYKVLRFRSLYTMSPSQMCEILTISRSTGDCNGNGGGTWRRMPCPPEIVIQKSMTMVAGVAYFLVNRGYTIKADNIVLFDLAKEEWRPTKVPGPLSRSGHVLLTRVGDCLAFVHCNYENSSADVWFLVDVDKPVWTKRYSMPVEPFGMYPRFYRPLVVLDDGRVAVSIEGARIIKAYDPETRTWTHLVRLKDYRAISVHHGSLLCAGVHG